MARKWLVKSKEQRLFVDIFQKTLYVLQTSRNGRI